MQQLLCSLFTVYFFVLFARILFSWFPIEPGSGVARVYSILYDLTEPVLAPVRNLIPPVGGGGMALDLSPIVVFVGLAVLQRAICG